MSDVSTPPPKRPRGRPREVDQGQKLTTLLPVATFDRLCRKALREGKTLSAVVRELLVLPRKP